jgi:murein DD-endopeptidase MepM/ murein hydrolase activator NlpD
LALFVLANTISVPQGSAFELRVPHQEGVQTVTARWQDKDIPLARLGNDWIAFIGVDLDVKAGLSPVSVKMKLAKQVVSQTVDVTVTAVQFPTRILEVEPKYVNPPESEEKRIIAEDTELKKIHRTITAEKLWSGPFRAPVDGPVEASSFGARSVFNGQSRAPHAGADLRAVTGTRILATNRGRVVLAKDLYFTGNTVIIDHGLGVYSLYAHLSRIDVKVGQLLENGQLLGLSGATGRVTGPHLHWGIKAQDARVDPFSLIDIAKHSVTVEPSESR